MVNNTPRTASSQGDRGTMFVKVLVLVLHLKSNGVDCNFFQTMGLSTESSL